MKNAVHTTPNLRLGREREQRGWSQEDVAKKIGAPDDKIVRRWESGKVSPSPHYRQTLCNFYGKSAEELGLIQYDTSPTWNIPYRRNPFFTGREKLLTLLHEKLTTNNAAALTQAQAISGLGGIGKTQVAVGYAYRYRDEYHTVLWVRAAARDSLIADFVIIAGLLHLPEKDEQDQKIVIAAVKRWLANHVGWLLIVDNADDLDLARDFLPTGDNGHILLTTRAQAAGVIANSIEVEKMDVEEGTLLLLRRSKTLAANVQGSGAAVPLRPCGIEDFVSRMRHHWSNVIKAASYLHSQECRDTFIRKERGDKSMM